MTALGALISLGLAALAVAVYLLADFMRLVDRIQASERECRE